MAAPDYAHLRPDCGRVESALRPTPPVRQSPVWSHPEAQSTRWLAADGQRGYSAKQLTALCRPDASAAGAVAPCPTLGGRSSPSCPPPATESLADSAAAGWPAGCAPPAPR